MVNPRNAIKGIDAFRKWAAAASRGESVTYHVGSLSSDRASNAELNDLAECVHLLTCTGYVSPRQYPMRLTNGVMTIYTCHRTGVGFAPRSIIHGTLTPTEYMALVAVRDRPADQSALRAIRFGVNCPDAVANAIFKRLKAANMVEPAEVKGWRVSPDGFLALS